MNSNTFCNIETEEAFKWLTQPESIQGLMLELYLKNYRQPVYLPHDISKHLRKALESEIFGYRGSLANIRYAMLTVYILRHVSLHGWDIIEEKGD